MKVILMGFKKNILSEIHNRDKVIISSIFFAGFFKLLSAISIFILSVFLARNFGADESGYYFLSLTLVTFLSVISRVGLDNTVLRFTATAFELKNWSQIRMVLLTGLSLSFFLSAIIIFLLYTFSDFISEVVFQKPKLQHVLRGMSISVIGLSLLTLVAMSFQGLRRSITSIIILSLFTNLLIILYLIFYSGENIYVVAKVYSLVIIAIFILSMLYWFFVISPEDSSLEVVTWTEIFRSCMPLWLVMIMSQLIQWSGQLIAGAMVDTSELAMFSAALRTAMLTSFVLLAVNFVLAPRFAAMHHQGDKKGLENTVLTSTKWIILLALPVAMLMFIFPKFFMSLFGYEFIPGSLLLQILVVGQFINVVTGSVGYLLTMTGNEKSMRNTMLIGGVFSIISAYILISIFGVVGGAIATSLSIAGQNLLAAWYVYRKLGINTLIAWRW